MSNIFILFITVFFAVYLSVNYYVFRRAKQALSLYPTVIKYFNWLFWLLPFSLILGRVIENWSVNIFSTIFIWVGSIWLGALVYFVIFCLLVDFIRLITKIFKLQNLALVFNEKQKLKLGAGVLLLVFLITAGGIVNVFFPVLRTINVDISNKSLENERTIRMLVVSDIHLGTLVGKYRLNKLIETINTVKPDIVVLAGDIVDEDIASVIKQDLGGSLLAIKPPLGIYGITGNHEYIGGVDSAVDYLSTHGIKMLRDQLSLVDNSFYLVGREDRSSERMGAKTRKSLSEIFTEVTNDLPVVLLDHQPFDLKSVADFGKVDLQISGHTHNGQLWPFNYIVDMIYEIPYGYGIIGQTQFYVSNGYGTWGPPLRVGNRPEMVFMNINFVD